MRLHLPGRLWAFGLGLVLVASLLVVLRPSAPEPPAPVESVRLSAASPTRSDYQVYAGSAFAKGSTTGAKASSSGVVITSTTKVSTPYGTANKGTWTSPWTRGRVSFTQLVPSWKIASTAGSWIEVSVRGRTASGRTGTFDQVARWSPREDVLKRTSFGAQTDDLTKVSTDTLVSQVGALRDWQVSVTLFRKVGAKTPTLQRVGAVATMPGSVPATSKPLYGAKTLAVPEYSQMIHRGEYPQYGNGGEAWCSPTSTAMIVGYYKQLPPPAQYAWVKQSYRDRWVDHFARITYDHAYEGTGNWPFNTAMASYVGDGFVTRLDSLRQAEQFIHAGIPLAASIAFGRGELSGAPISASNGHLVVISGFTSKGDVVVNDPAAPNDSSVRRTYQRAQFEKVWQRGSLGTVYVIRDTKHPLPKATSTNW